MPPDGMMDPKFYYAAGILVWIKQHRRPNFIAEELQSWWQDDRFDNYSTLYFSDERLLQEALDYLVEIKAIGVVRDTYGPDAYLANYVEELEMLSDRYVASPFWKAHTLGAVWLKKTLIEVSSREKNVSLTTPPNRLDQNVDRWEPLELNRGATEIQEVFQKLDEAVRDIGADNGFATEFPAERDNLLTHAKATLSSARDGKVTKSQIKQHFVAAGKWLAEKFGGTAIGTAGSELAKWGLRLLGMI